MITIQPDWKITTNAELPTVEERTTGRWVVKQRGGATDVYCSECNEIRFKDYSWGYTAEEIQAKIDNDEEMPKFCENCGARMKGSAENDSKGTNQ